MNRTLMRENAFRLLYSLEVQKNKEINIEEQIELYIESNNITNTEAIEYMKDAILGIEKNKVEIKALIDNGKLVSDELMAKLLKEKIGSLGNVKGIIFDGFPRTLEQAHMLDEILNEVGMKVNKVIYFDIDKDTAMKRALGRVTCKDCGEIYNTYFDTFLKEDECSKCGGKLEKRMDDTEEKFSNRFDTYLEKTKPLIDYYTNLNLLETVNCSDSKNNIFNKIKFIIEK